MKKTKQKQKTGSLADFILIVLLATSLLSVIFRPQIQRFLGEIDETDVEYTFIIESVSENAMNKPSENERIYTIEGNANLGTISEITEKKITYKDDYSEEITLSTLQCTANGKFIRTESGLEKDGVFLKSGSQIKVKTDSSSFLMTVLSIKTQTK